MNSMSIETYNNINDQRFFVSASIYSYPSIHNTKAICIFPLLTAFSLSTRTSINNDERGMRFRQKAKELVQFAIALFEHFVVVFLKKKKENKRNGKRK